LNSGIQAANSSDQMADFERMPGQRRQAVRQQLSIQSLLS
jgi:hypothetical protein